MTCRYYTWSWSKDRQPHKDKNALVESHTASHRSRTKWLETDGWQWRGRTIDDWQLHDDEIDDWQLYDDDIDDWQLRGKEANTVDASVVELGTRCMYLEIWTTESDRRHSRSKDRERVKANQLAPQERTQTHMNEPNFIAWNGIRNLYSEEIKVLKA